MMALVQAGVVQPHAKLVDTMFLVGAVMAFIPFAVVGGLVGFLYWKRRQRSGSGGTETKTPPA